MSVVGSSCTVESSALFLIKAFCGEGSEEASFWPPDLPWHGIVMATVWDWGRLGSSAPEEGTVCCGAKFFVKIGQVYSSLEIGGASGKFCKWCFLWLSLPQQAEATPLFIFMVGLDFNAIHVLSFLHCLQNCEFEYLGEQFPLQFCFRLSANLSNYHRVGYSLFLILLWARTLHDKEL